MKPVIAALPYDPDLGPHTRSREELLKLSPEEIVDQLLPLTCLVPALARLVPAVMCSICSNIWQPKAPTSQSDADAWCGYCRSMLGLILAEAEVGPLANNFDENPISQQGRAGRDVRRWLVRIVETRAELIARPLAKRVEDLEAKVQRMQSELRPEAAR